MVEDWTGVIFGMGVLILGTILVVVVLLVASSLAKAKVARRDEEKLEELVKRYEALSTQLREHQETLAADTGDVRRRVVEIERILREVD
ncbi:hypothetical protein GOARA_014_00060 [Gordonia araii NBRC 100433]|uniref:Uncharacterized protein n=1 Tax=Gordonia araii NBRC 100433 TaxID=1073574 RepID=G7GYI3_9ACTN|nr:hypothetical protein [Gordonia araii]NNG99076.1 hypothetical protein [Gordonia araii NBRC 100433]GAB08658.1 hypothetical protein GOARA_014_00060 [Gordonia araii NBRC 100433]